MLKYMSRLVFESKIFGLSRVVLISLGPSWGSLLRRLVAVFCRLGVLFGGLVVSPVTASRMAFGRSWTVPRRSWAPLGRFWDTLGRLLDGSWGLSGGSWAHAGYPEHPG